MKADLTLHFAAGMIAGSAFGLRALVAAWFERRRLAPAFLVWFAWSYGGGLFASVPTILRSIGISNAFCSGWWMNIFVFHPLLGRLKPGGGLLIGEVLLIAQAGVQYYLLLWAIHHAKLRSRPSS